MLLEELNNVRSEMERQRMLAAQGDAELQQAEMMLDLTLTLTFTLTLP